MKNEIKFELDKFDYKDTYEDELFILEAIPVMNKVSKKFEPII